MRGDIDTTDFRPWLIEEVPVGEEIVFKDGSEEYGFIEGIRFRDNGVRVFWQKERPLMAYTDCQTLFDLCLVRRSDLGGYLPCGTLIHKPILHSHCDPPTP